MSSKCGTEWDDLNLLKCLESLYGRHKLFNFKEKKDHWECSTFVKSSMVTAKAPTKVEAYRVVIISILKEFYYFPFDDRMELPTGNVGENSFIGNPFQKQFVYPVFKTFVFDEMQKFFFKEKAIGKISCLITFNYFFY